MKNSKRILSMFLLITLLSIGVSGKAQRQYSRVNTRQVSDLLQRLAQSSDRFRISLNTAVGQGRADERRGNDINSLERDFRNATNQFTDLFKRRRAGAENVRDVLQKASLINDVISRRRFDTQARQDWASVRLNLEGLARAYAVDWQWNPQTPSPVSSGGPSRLSDRDLDQLIRRIETGGETFRLSLTDAFGRSRFDQTRGEGRMNDAVGSFKNATDQVRNRFDARQSVVGEVEQLLARATPVDAYMRDNKLTGQAQNDWSTLRGDLQGLAGAYNIAPNWNANNSSQPVLTNTPSSSGTFIVRDGESLVAVLNTDLTTRQAKQGDRFAMTVRQPSQYSGAVIEGSIAGVERGGRLSGRSQMSLNFETIRLRNGQIYGFAGAIDSVRTQDGETVKVDNEGSAQGDNQTTRTIERAGVGTAIGAIIGAIAGGGKGAVIGGVVGAAGGAGSVYVQGKDDLELLSGTELIIRASAPK
jgi:hypothetical protein